MFSTLFRILFATSLLVFAINPLIAMDASTPSTGTSDRRGPLKKLPSSPGPHVKGIQAMSANTWLPLGLPKADPKWGVARGRSWSSEMVYAPELRGAFFMGTGVHAFVKPDGHYQDDLWVYDIPANRWICAYPGTPKNLQLKLDERGFEVDESGMPVPVDSTGHATCNATYDPVHQQYIFMPRTMPRGWVGRHVPQRAGWLAKGKPADCRHPWAFNARSGTWDRFHVQGEGPKSAHCSLFQYVPSVKKPYFLYSDGKMWSFDRNNNSWTRHPTKGDRSIGGYNFVAAFDSKRSRIAQMLGNKLWFYDVTTDTGSNPNAKGQEEVTAKSCVNSSLTYDTRNDVFVLFLYGPGKDKADRKGLYLYNCAANEWTTTPVPVHPDMVKRYRDLFGGFYDPELNVHFFYGAPDSSDKGAMWAYRVK